MTQRSLLIEALIEAIDEAKAIARTQLERGNDKRLERLIEMLDNLQSQAIHSTLDASANSLGLYRFASDWVESLDSPLLTAIAEVEARYRDL